jgi:hypothetical protein
MRDDAVIRQLDEIIKREEQMAPGEWFKEMVRRGVIDEQGRPLPLDEGEDEDDAAEQPATVRLAVEIPSSLHQNISDLAAKAGLGLGDWLVRLLTDEVAASEGPAATKQDLREKAG